jgi:hypothetical protein
VFERVGKAGEDFHQNRHRQQTRWTFNGNNSSNNHLPSSIRTYNSGREISEPTTDMPVVSVE